MLSLFFSATTPYEFQTVLERDFSLISNWYLYNGLTLNVKQIKMILAGNKSMQSRMKTGQGTSVQRMESFKYLGVTADEKRSWKIHLRNLFRKLSHRLSVL